MDNTPSALPSFSDFIPILYEDYHVVVVEKPAGVSVQENNNGAPCLLKLLQKQIGCKILLTHRIDQAATGIVVFAKTHNAQKHINQQFQAGQVQKWYWAVTENTPEPLSGDLEHYIRHNTQENRAYIAYSKQKGAQIARMHYHWLAKSDRYNLIEVLLETGRPHQIRCQLAAIGCPIKGDVKYGARRANHNRSIHLHARRICLQLPFSFPRLDMVASVPADDTLWVYFQQQLNSL